MRQLDIFKGKRQRGEEPPPALEFSTACALADRIALLIQPGWIWSHLPFGEHRNVVTGVRLKRQGTKRGWPDYAFVGPDGAVFWLELKRSKLGHLSEFQKRFAEHCAANGHDYYCARGYDDAVLQLEVRGIIRRAMP